jgi:hypothetical protein
MKAAGAVKIDWDAGPTAEVSEADILAEGAKLVADPASGALFVNEGDVTVARAAAAKTHGATYRTSTALPLRLGTQYLGNSSPYAAPRGD